MTTPPTTSDNNNNHNHSQHPATSISLEYVLRQYSYYTQKRKKETQKHTKTNNVTFLKELFFFNEQILYIQLLYVALIKVCFFSQHTPIIYIVFIKPFSFYFM